MEKPKLFLVQRRSGGELDSGLSELCRMMRLMSDRDVDGTIVQVLKTMMVGARGRPVGGSDLSRASGLNRITVIHHLRRLEGAGFVRRQEGGKYLLRVQSAEEMLMEFRRETEQAFSEMDELAREIDDQFKLIDGRFGENGPAPRAQKPKEIARQAPSGEAAAGNTRRIASQIGREFDERHRRRKEP